MNQLQLNHKSMFETTYQTMQNNIGMWSSNGTISAVVAALYSKIGDLNDAVTGQLSNYKVVTQSKNEAKTTLIALTMAHAMAGKGFGASSGYSTLKGICKITETQLKEMAEDELGNFCETLYDAVSPVIGSLAGYGVNSASLLQWSNTIGAFESKLGQPQSARQAAASYTAIIEPMIKDIGTYIEEQLDTVMLQYKTSNITFYKAYKGSRKLPKNGHRTTVKVTGVVSEGNAPVVKAHVMLVANGQHTRKKITKVTGKFMFARLKPGTYVITVSANGMVAQSKTITIAYADSVMQNFNMIVAGGIRDA